MRKTLVGNPSEPKSITGGVALDSIPLNWTKHKKLIALLLRVLKMSVGPYDYNNSLKELDTT